jgi:hypothetical protein
MWNSFDERATRAVIDAHRETLIRDGRATPRRGSGDEGAGQHSSLRLRLGRFLVRYGQRISGVSTFETAQELDVWNRPRTTRRERFGSAGSWR